MMREILSYSISTIVLSLCFVKLVLSGDCDGVCDLMSFHAPTFFIRADSLNVGSILSHSQKRSFTECCAACDVLDRCSGVAFLNKECSLLDDTAEASFVETDGSNQGDYKVMLFQSQAPDHKVVYNCKGDCPQCETTRKDCKAYYDRGFTTDGKYNIDPGLPLPFDAYCDMAEGGWTVIQRRVDLTMAWDREWAEYVAGFDSAKGNYWAGLDKMHALTSQACPMMLHVTMSTWEGESAWAEYEHFHVAGPSDGYRLTVSGYSGTAGDSLTYHSNMMFSTRDRDQDLYVGSCAAEHYNGWWFNNCFMANPNGPMPSTSPVCEPNIGLIWETYKGNEYSLKTMLLKIKRI